MANPILPLFFLSLLVSAVAAATATNPSCTIDRSSSPAGTTELPIFHIYSKCSPFSQPTQPSPGLDSLLAMARGDTARLAYLASRVSSVPIASGQQVMQTANYILRLKLGMPGQLMYMALDTSADAAWVPCSGCIGCPTTRLFSPAGSLSFAVLNCTSPWCTRFKGQCCSAISATSGGGRVTPCFFNQSYGAGSSFAATLAQDSLQLARDTIPNYAFGCVNSVSVGNSLPKQGLLGLGRGPTSLLAQSGSLYQGVFSYCLPSFKSYYFSGSLRLGPVGQPRSIRTTPLLRNPHRPSLYYVNLTGISVGRTRVALPPDSLAFDRVTGAGTIIDSGTVITRFVKPVYEALKAEFRRQVGAMQYTSLGAFDTCFVAPVNELMAATPPMVLHFEGLNFELPAENVLIHSSATPVACLAMAAAPDNVNSVVNVIANLQQQNHRVLFDVANSRVGFARELCN